RIVVSSVASFEQHDVHDQPAVRAYRAALASARQPGFGLDACASGGRGYLAEDAFPLGVHARKDLLIETTVFAPHGRRGAGQIVRITTRRAGAFAPAWTGAMHLRRAVYTQLTPGGPLPAMGEMPV